MHLTRTFVICHYTSVKLEKSHSKGNRNDSETRRGGGAGRQEERKVEEQEEEGRGGTEREGAAAPATAAVASISVCEGAEAAAKEGSILHPKEKNKML